MVLEISQERLGQGLGLTFQQIQKYEKGVNRIGSSRLFEISKILDVPVGYFFEGLNDGETAAAPVDDPTKALRTPVGIRIAKAINAMPENLRLNFANIGEALASANGESDNRRAER